LELPEKPSELPEKPKARHLSAVLIAILILSLLVGGIIGYGVSSLTTSSQISSLQDQVSTLKTTVSNLQSAEGQPTQNITYENATVNNTTYVLGENFSLSQLYDQVKDSVVEVETTMLEGYDFAGNPVYGGALGSGFVSNLTGQFVIITNYHVIEGAINVTVTFADGDTYVANVTGEDPYADLATLSTEAPQTEYEPLNITSSSTLQVGDPVIAVGNPLGLTGSMTSGVVSALGRAVQVQGFTYDMYDCIQTTAPINPGNSGGPLLNYQGEVVGITSYTATYEGEAAEGLGFAQPSDTILREVPSLIANGSYTSHSWLGASGNDMDPWIWQAMNTTVTYGWLISSVTSGGPADTAGLRGGTTQFLDPNPNVGTYVTIGGDIIIAMNGTRIKGEDDLSSYLEEYTLPGQTINVTVVRNNQTVNIAVKLGTRPPPT
jgi:S1-C subfamily serine protease